MQAGLGEVGGVALFRRECAHGVYGRRLAVVRPGVHALNAKSLVDPQQLDRREIQLLFSSSPRAWVSAGIGSNIAAGASLEETSRWQAL